MLKILQIMFTIIVVVCIACFLFTKNYYFIVVMNIFFGLAMLVAGLIEFKKGKMKYTRRDGYERCEQAL